MDLTLIPSLIQDLLIKNECFILPETGRFTVVATPATFLEGGKGILPPGRKLVFEQGNFQGDIAPWQKELHSMLMLYLAENGKFELPGFGLFTDDGDGKISFEVSPEFDYAPDSFSLDAIALEVNPETEFQEEPELQVEIEPEPEVEVQKKPQPVAEDHEPKNLNRWLVWALVAAVAVLVIVLFIILFKEQFTQMLRNLLYTEEELQIIEQWRHGYNL